MIKTIVQKIAGGQQDKNSRQIDGEVELTLLGAQVFVFAEQLLSGKLDSHLKVNDIGWEGFLIILQPVKL